MLLFCKRGIIMTEGKKKSPAAAVLNFIGTAIIVIVIVLCLSLIVPKFFGINSYTVLTGSMEPSIPVGSLVCAKSTEPDTLAVGDVIVFYDGINSIPVTHRVVENQTDSYQIITKGDANAANDITPVDYVNVVGKVVLCIPVLGRLLVPLGTLMGKIAMLAIILGGFLMCEVARRISK